MTYCIYPLRFVLRRREERLGFTEPDAIETTVHTGRVIHEEACAEQPRGACVLEPYRR
jgi:hypothetical protein